MNCKRFLMGAAAGLVLLCLILSGALHHPGLFRTQPEEGLFRTHEKEIQIRSGDGWQRFSLSGVNIGTGYPGLFPNESGISEETYYRWFRLISDMNANTIRVYQLQPPAFYNAFARFNRDHEKHLYLIQGVDFQDRYLYTLDNLLDSSEALLRHTRQTVDAVHGDHMALDSRQDQLHIYLTDVSDYVLGYLLGIEWDKTFVEYTCRINDLVEGYDGTYLRCDSGATPFECFLARWGDELLRHEARRYGQQHLLSFANWPETDPLDNDLNTFYVPHQQANREQFIDLEHIHPTGDLTGGLFASYNVYPYYPDFLQGGPYTAFVDETGVRNPYRCYLSELTAHHTIPVVVSEFGVPASRSSAYRDLWRDFSHGGLNETEQGQAVAALLHDIRSAGCAGSMVFTWQDEWYKTVWNESLLSDPDRRAFWSNAMCAEQGFGLLAFEPGEQDQTCYPDGSLTDWQAVSPVYEGNGLQLSVQQDARYLYFLARGQLDGPLTLALDTLPEHGRAQAGQLHFEGGEAEFLIRIDPGGTGGIYVDRSYDLLPYSILGSHIDLTLHNLAALQEKSEQLPVYPGCEDFVLVMRGDNDLTNHLASQTLLNRVGRLKAGNTNPASPLYDSNADFCIGQDAVEIRIPWQLLNFTDPSRSTVADALTEGRLTGRKIRRIRLAAALEAGEQTLTLAPWELTGWEKPRWHERLKQSYYILQDALESVN